MDNLRVIILFVGCLIGIYHVYLGVKKANTDGFKFNIEQIFRHRSISKANSGNLIFDGLICFFSVFMLYGFWHRWHW